MSYLTRNLLSYTIGRNAGEPVTFITNAVLTANGDGSYTPTITETPKMARVDDLTINQIQRLQDRGLTINKGINVSVVGEELKAPDRIRRADGTTFKVIDFAINENASVFICDLPPLGEAVE